MLHGLLILLASSAVTASVQPQTVHSRALAALNDRFVCPELLPNDEARQQASVDFWTSYQKAYPSAAPASGHAYWHVLLNTHNCKEAPPPRVVISTRFHF